MTYPVQLSQLQRTRRLASAFKRLDRAQAAYEAAKLQFDAEFGPWSAGRRIDRDVAREQLVSTGHLEPSRTKR